jgi:aspartyl-tRNA synthetase
VTLFGWLAVCRHRFLVLRDAYGVVQVRLSKTQAEAAKKIPNESVLRVEGVVVERGPAATTKIPTGAIEVGSLLQLIATCSLMWTYLSYLDPPIVLGTLRDQ